MNLQGTWLWYDSKNTPFPADGFISRLAAGPDGRVWMTILRQTTDATGRPAKGWIDSIVMYDGEGWTLFPLGERGLPESGFGNIACDQIGSLWLLAASNGTLCRFDGRSTEVFQSGSRGLPADKYLFITDFVADKQRGFFAAMGSSGVYHFDGAIWNKFESPKDTFKEGFATRLAVDKRGYLWCTVSEGKTVHFMRWDDSRWEEHITATFKRMPDTVEAFAFDEEGNLWAGWSEQAVWVWHAKEGKWTKFNLSNSALPSSYIDSVVVDNRNRVWIGTGGGIAVFEGQESACWGAVKPNVLDKPSDLETLRRIRRTEGPPTANIFYPTVSRYVVLDSQGRIWADGANAVGMFMEA